MVAERSRSYGGGLGIREAREPRALLLTVSNHGYEASRSRKKPNEMPENVKREGDTKDMRRHA